jgi:hypothetical protein
MSSGTTYPVFLASPRRDSQIEATSSAKGVVAFAHKLELPRAFPARHLLIWRDHVVLVADPLVVLYDRDGQKKWVRQKGQRAFAVAGGDRLYYRTTRQLLDAAGLDGKLVLEGAKLPLVMEESDRVPLFWPLEKEFVAVILTPGHDDKPTLNICYRRVYNDQYSVWSHDVHGDPVLPPLLVPEKERLVVMSDEVTVIETSSGKRHSGFKLPVSRPVSWSAGVDGTLYIAGQDQGENDKEPAGVLVAVGLDGKERWRWKGSAKLLSWSRAQGPVPGRRGLVYAFIQDGALAIKDGKLAWDWKPGGPVAYGTLLGDETLLVAAGRHLARLKSDGNELFTVDVKEAILTPPVVDAGGAIYVATATHLVKIQ